MPPTTRGQAPGPAPKRRLVLPPPYDQHWQASGDVMAAAERRAPKSGAGTLVWRLTQGLRHGTGQGTWQGSRPGTSQGSRPGPGRLDFAVVLEPAEPLAKARRAFLAGMVALGDAVAAHCPAERAVRFGYPGEVILDEGRLGGARMSAAPGCGEDEVPDWLVFAVELIADRDHLDAPGAYPASVSLKEEQFLDPALIVESFAAHLMLNFDRWAHQGFDAVGKPYLARLGQGSALTATGDLRGPDGIRDLAKGIVRSDWRGDQGPRL